MAKHVPGKKGPLYMLYALSTCPWCQKTKRLLDEMGLEIQYEDVDLLSGDARRDACPMSSAGIPAARSPP
jgi:hypothetical protein